jgi:hypothetical protein
MQVPDTATNDLTPVDIEKHNDPQQLENMDDSENVDEKSRETRVTLTDADVGLIITKGLIIRIECCAGRRISVSLQSCAGSTSTRFLTRRFSVLGMYMDLVRMCH